MGGRGRLEREDTAGLTPAEGRKFGLTVGVAFLALASLFWWRGHGTLQLIALVAGGGLVLSGLLVPGRLGPIYRGWMRMAELISRVTTPIFMGVIYFLVVTPIGVLLRLFGRNPLSPPEDRSYWATRGDDTRKDGKSDMRRQF